MNRLAATLGLIGSLFYTLNYVIIWNFYEVLVRGDYYIEASRELAMAAMEGVPIPLLAGCLLIVIALLFAPTRREYNAYELTLKTVGWSVLALGITVGAGTWINYDVDSNFFVGIYVIGASVMSGVFFLGLGEIVGALNRKSPRTDP